MDTRTLAAPRAEHAVTENGGGRTAAGSLSDEGPWTEFARLMAETYRYAPLFA